jgi:thioredoxin 1
MTARGLAATILGAILTTACGGSSSSPTAVPTPAPTPTSSSMPVVLDSTNFDALVLASGQSCLVEFQRSSCPYCQAMVPIVTRLASDFAGRALVGTVDTALQPARARAYGVSSVPTFVFFRGGREVSRQVGTTSYDDLAAKLNALIASP